VQKIGIVGGVAWPSTLEYYRLLCKWANEHFLEHGSELPLPTPPMLIESLVMHETRRLRAKPGSGEAGWAAFDTVIRDALLRLQSAGCDFAIIANNTMHTRLHAVRVGLDIPIVSILEAVAAATRKCGARRALVLGTSVTMRADDFSRALQAANIEPNERLEDKTIEGLQSLIDTEFYGPQATTKGRTELMKLCTTLVDDPRTTVVLLACTELPLAFPEHAESEVFESGGFTFVNTTAVHVRAALNRSLGLGG
jgi:aspartate racemase